MADNKLEEYYICYFDVLGYKKYFEEEHKDDELLNKIKKVLDMCKQDMELAHKIVDIDLEIKSFSDNFILCVNSTKKTKNDKLGILIFAVRLIQFFALKNYGLLIRGGITKGKLYLDTDIVYGEALVKAVKLEEGAIFPRIVIDEICLDNETLKERNILYIPVVKDIDEKYCINYFLTMYTFNNRDIIKCRKSIMNMIKKDGSFLKKETKPEQIKVRESIITKVLWTVMKYNEACEEKDQIKFVTRINPKLLKMELALEEQERTTNEK